jgi:hypothetical protein
MIQRRLREGKNKMRSLSSWSFSNPAITQHDPKFFLCQICLDVVVAILEREREETKRVVMERKSIKKISRPEPSMLLSLSSNHHHIKTLDPTLDE